MNTHFVNFSLIYTLCKGEGPSPTQLANAAVLTYAGEDTLALVDGQPVLVLTARTHGGNHTPGQQSGRDI